TTTHLFWEMLLAGGIVLAVFFVLDSYLHSLEGGLPKIKDPTPDKKVRLRGLANVPLLVGVIVAILISGVWRPGGAFTVAGVSVEWQNLLRDIAILALAGVSLLVSREEYRTANGFNWAPIAEVAKLFFGIFICIIPVIAILRAGPDGALAPLVSLVTGADGQPNNLAYFWLTGILSSLLDNA